MDIFVQFLGFFLGTPRRAVRTTVVALIAAVVLSDAFRGWLIGQTVEAIEAVLPLALVGGLIVWGFRVMLGPLFPGHRRRH